MANDDFWEKVRRDLADSTARLLPWHRLPPLFGILKLVEMRKQLRASNLVDTSRIDVAADAAPPSPPPQPARLDLRTADGTWNDLEVPTMGAVGQRFGRNLPLERSRRDPAQLLDPSPREVSRRLLRRDQFIPVPTLNLLAAAWIQFETHDWFAHGDADRSCPIEIPLRDDDDWHERPMKVGRSHPDPTRAAGWESSATPVPTHQNQVTHWWDGSQLYGSDEATVRRLRSGHDGKLRLDERGLLPVDPKSGLEQGGFTDNWWVGLSVLHRLFAREHNAICDRLKIDYPTWSDDELFGKARLVNAALMAKIHTVEWTPAILNTPTLKTAMSANWWGLQTEELRKLAGRFSPDEALSGIPGSAKDHHGAPFAMTEEFVAVYRMHPLLPDEYYFRSLTSEQLVVRSLRGVQGRFTRTLVEEVAPADLLYSFGLQNPGALTLHNYPVELQRLERLDGTILDLGAIDVLRDRERGIPRYNEFRRLLHMPAVRSFEELTDNPVWREELREIYGGDLEKVDLMIGMYAETPPEGFGFSDTAFRIFILMASRRLKGDRFYTTDFNEQTYTKAGLAWVQSETMTSVLLRHHPELAPCLQDIDNPFFPWRPIERAGE